LQRAVAVEVDRVPAAVQDKQVLRDSPDLEHFQVLEE
jgi:hypothetical protein